MGTRFKGGLLCEQGKEDVTAVENKTMYRGKRTEDAVAGDFWTSYNLKLLIPEGPTIKSQIEQNLSFFQNL